jgi:hypothetical protein
MVVFWQLNEGVIKEKSRKVPTRTGAFDSGREFWERINTQTR